jgi:hypothetical protein
VDTVAPQSFGEHRRCGMTGKAEERCSAKHGKVCSFQHGIEPVPIRLKPGDRLGEPMRVAERRLADPQRGA